jgi:hypothetical protein
MDAFPLEWLSREHQRILDEANQRHDLVRLLGAYAFELCCLL